MWGHRNDRGLTEALSWAPGCVSRLRIDSLSESQDPHQASSGSRRASMSDETLAFTCTSHTWWSLITYEGAKSG